MGSLAQSAPEQEPRSLNTASNPIAIEQGAAVEQAQAQLRILERSYFPKLTCKPQLTPAVRVPMSTGRAWEVRMALGRTSKIMPSVLLSPFLCLIYPLCVPVRQLKAQQFDHK